MKMMEFNSEIKNVDDSISAFNYNGSSIVKNDNKASSWAQSNPNSSNSQNDNPLGTMIGLGIKSQKVPGMIITTNKPLGVITHIITLVI